MRCGDHARLAGARAGEDEERAPVAVHDRGALRGVEAREEGGVGARGTAGR